MYNTLYSNVSLVSKNWQLFIVSTTSQLYSVAYFKASITEGHSKH